MEVEFIVCESAGQTWSTYVEEVPEDIYNRGESAILEWAHSHDRFTKMGAVAFIGICSLNPQGFFG